MLMPQKLSYIRKRHFWVGLFAMKGTWPVAKHLSGRSLPKRYKQKRNLHEFFLLCILEPDLIVDSNGCDGAARHAHPIHHVGMALSFSFNTVTRFHVPIQCSSVKEQTTLWEIKPMFYYNVSNNNKNQQDLYSKPVTEQFPTLKSSTMMKPPTLSQICQ